MRIVVVGCGVIGAAIADALALRGAEVIVLDSRATGQGASRASAGILAPYTEATPESGLLPLGVRSLAMYDRFIEGVVARSGRQVEYARTGTLQVAQAGETEHLRSAFEWLRDQPVDAAWLSAADLSRIEPSITSDAGAGLLISRHGFVDVRSLVAALVQSARLSGAVVQTGADIASIRSTRGGVILKSGAVTWEADVAIVTAGSWSGKIRVEGIPRAPVRPVRGQLLHLRWSGAAAHLASCGDRSATRCRGQTGPCSSAQRLKTSDSTSG